MTSNRRIMGAIRRQLAALRRGKVDDRIQAINELEDRRDPLAEVLFLYLLDDRSAWVRERAARALFGLGGTMARIAARLALHETETSVRDDAAETLGRIGRAWDVPRLISATFDPEWVVRAEAAESLSRLGGRAARECLLEALAEEQHPTVRRYLAIALSDLKDPAVIPALEAALAREDHNHARAGLLWALYSLGQPERLEPLLALLDDQHWLVQCSVVNLIPTRLRPEDRRRLILALQQLLEREERKGLRADIEAALKRLRGQEPEASADGSLSVVPAQEATDRDARPKGPVSAAEPE